MARTLTARERLRLWCRPRGRITELARATGSARSTAHRWLSGETLPAPSAAILIEQATGIGRDGWDMLRAARRAAA